MNKFLYFIIYISLLAAIQSCKNPAKVDKNTPMTIAVTATVVKSELANYYTAYPANIVALKEVDLRGNVSGYVTGIFFTERFAGEKRSEAL